MPSPPCQSLLPKARYSRNIKRSVRLGRFSVIALRCSRAICRRAFRTAPARRGDAAVCRYPDRPLRGLRRRERLDVRVRLRDDVRVPTSGDGVNPTRQFHRNVRPLLVEEKSLTAEGEIFHTWLSHLVREIREAAQAIAAGKQSRGWHRTAATIQCFIWDRLTFNHLCRLMSRHLLRVQGRAPIPGVDTSLMSWLFPGDTTLQDADYISRDSPITIVADAVNALLAAPIPITILLSKSPTPISPIGSSGPMAHGGSSASTSLSGSAL